FGAFACFRLIDGVENICRRDWPIARTGNNSSVVQNRARGILPFVNFWIEIWLQDVDRVRAGVRPEQLQSANDAQLAESNKIRRVNELLVCERVRQAGISVGLARGRNTVERSLDRAVSKCMHVND